MQQKVLQQEAIHQGTGPPISTDQSFLKNNFGTNQSFSKTNLISPAPPLEQPSQPNSAPTFTPEIDAPQFLPPQPPMPFPRKLTIFGNHSDCGRRFKICMIVFNFIAIGAYLAAAIIGMQVTGTDKFDNMTIFSQAENDWVKNSWTNFKWD